MKKYQRQTATRKTMDPKTTNENPETSNIPEQIVQIRSDLHTDVKRLAMLIAHHSSIIQGLENELVTLLRVGHGVDLKNPEWRLDIDHGALLHIPTQTPSPDNGEHNEHGQSK